MLLAQEHCPNCGRRHPRRSHDLVLHYLRTFRGRSHRYCPACRIHWHAAHMPVPGPKFLTRGNRIELLLVLSAILAAALAAEIPLRRILAGLGAVAQKVEAKIRR